LLRSGRAVTDEHAETQDIFVADVDPIARIRVNARRTDPGGSRVVRPKPTRPLATIVGTSHREMSNACGRASGSVGNDATATREKHRKPLKRQTTAANVFR
jgi:hypothetical protein